MATLALGWVAACGAPDATDHVAAQIDQAVEAAQRGDLTALGELVSFEYADPARRTRDDLLALVAPFVARGGLHVRTRISRLEEVVEGRVEGRVLVAAAQVPWPEGADPFADVRAELLAVDVVFVEERHGFRLLRAEWEPVRPGSRV